MTNYKCPYCNNQVSESDTNCPNCGKELNVQCPYCKQQIKAYDDVCPFCSTVLTKKDCSKILMIAGYIISTFWAIGNILILALFQRFPQIFKIERRNSETFMVADYLQVCAGMMLVQLVLFLIAYAIQSKVKNAAIAGIIINVVLMLFFVFYAWLIKFRYI